MRSRSGYGWVPDRSRVVGQCAWLRHWYGTHGSGATGAIILRAMSLTHAARREPLSYCQFKHVDSVKRRLLKAFYVTGIPGRLPLS